MERRRRTPNRPVAERIAEVQQRAARGETTAEIAAAIGVVEPYVRRLLRRTDIAEWSIQNRVKYQTRQRQAKEETIECLLCGYRLHLLGRHLVARHGITSKEYRERFPSAPTQSSHNEAIRRDLNLDRGTSVYWTKERIIQALRADARRRGRPPAKRDWKKATQPTPPTWPRSAADAAQRHRPASATVVRAFGSWNEAIIGAGLEPRPRHRPRSPSTGLCAQGHALTPDNLIRDGRDRYGEQRWICRTCHKAKQQRLRDKRRREKAAQRGKKAA